MCSTHIGFSPGYSKPRELGSAFACPYSCLPGKIMYSIFVVVAAAAIISWQLDTASPAFLCIIKSRKILGLLLAFTTRMGQMDIQHHKLRKYGFSVSLAEGIIVLAELYHVNQSNDLIYPFLKSIFISLVLLF